MTTKIKNNVYQICDFHDGEREPDLQRLYTTLRDQIFGTDPTLKSDADLFVVSPAGHRGNNYGWELFQSNGTSVMVEYWQQWGNFYIPSEEAAPQPLNPGESSCLDTLRISFVPPNREMQRKLEELIDESDTVFKKFPSTASPEKRSEILEQWSNSVLY